MAENSKSKGHWIGGVKVQFPGKPYPSQFAMMYKIIKGLESKQNCLLESPTGSGKSLALLCSSLAWLQTQYEKRKTEIIKVCDDSNACCGQTELVDLTISEESNKENETKKRNLSQDSDDFMPEKRLRKFCDAIEKNEPSVKIIDALPITDAKVVQPKTRIPKIFFGTRTHKQISQIVRELKKTCYSDASMTILSSRERTCIHHDVSASNNKNEACAELIENQNCMFYQNTRRFTMDSIKSNFGFDDAWDIEDFVKLGKKKRICPYFKLRDLMEEADIVFCPYNYLIDPIIRSSMDITLKGNIVLLDEAHNIEDTARDAASMVVDIDQLQGVIKDFENLARIGSMSSTHSYFTSKVSGLSQMINRQSEQLDDYSNFNQQSKTWSGAELIAMLQSIGLGPDGFGDFKNNLNLIGEEREKKIGGNDKKPSISNTTLMLLKKLFLSLHYLYKENMKFVEDFRFAIIRTMSQKPRPSKSGWISAQSSKSWTLSLTLMCLNPAVVFSDIKDEVHSLILTSGTLSPMKSFQSELGMPFQIQLEANHVIKDSQVWVGAISHGPKGSLLNGTFKNSETFIFQDEMGQLVLDVCDTIPYGVLCFTPSYSMIEKLVNRWQITGLWDKLAEKKRVICEPKSGVHDFEKLMAEFYETIEEATRNGTTVDGQNGALLFAVCRGKVSEGLDFADNNARAVITVGIPFPNFKDVQVSLKQAYNNKHCKSRSLLSGNEWYESQAFRALNQALGRCIRHKLDWGAIILVDERLTRINKYVNCFSKWVRNKIVNYSDFDTCKNSLAQFVETQLSNEDPNLTASNDTLPSSDMCTSLMSTADSSCATEVALHTIAQLLPSTPNVSQVTPNVELKEDESQRNSPNLF